MRKLLLALSLLIIITPAGVSKPARSFDASVSAETQENDRGVLGVRYAVGADLMKRTHVVVMNVVKGGPAEAAGLKTGDRIVAIDGVEVKTLPMKGVSPKMAGAPNTVLKLTVKRGLEEMQVAVVRGGLTKMPESGFKSRLLANGISEEKDKRIKKLSAVVATSQPLVTKDINEGNYIEAEWRLAKLLKKRKSPNYELLYAMLLDSQTSSGRHAEELLVSLTARHPQWIEAWRSLALHYEAAGNNAEAVAALKKAAMLSKDPEIESSIRAKIGELMERK